MRAGEDTSSSRLREERLGRGWTQKDVADRIGVHTQEIGRWERGETLPQPRQLAELCKLFNKTPQELALLRVPARDEYAQNGHQISIFPFNEQLVNRRAFYGRKRERHKLIDRTQKEASTSIVGPRRIGKTWLVKYLGLVALQELGPRFRLGYLDATLPGCATMAGFAQEALKQLGLPVPATPTGLVDLQHGLQALTAEGEIPVLCIDEFEYFSKRRDEFNATFYQGLRAMTQQTPPLVLVVVSRRPLYAILSHDNKDVSALDEETSLFFNIFEQITLKPFNDDEAEQFIREKSREAGFTKEESAYLWQYGKEGEQQWPPILLQIVGKMLLEDKQHQVKKDQHYRPHFEQRFAEILRGLGKR
jgi:transcriptional regulator with XRE-family HTH domain